MMKGDNKLTWITVTASGRGMKFWLRGGEIAPWTKELGCSGRNGIRGCDHRK